MRTCSALARGTGTSGPRLSGCGGDGCAVEETLRVAWKGLVCRSDTDHFHGLNVGATPAQGQPPVVSDRLYRG